jgi:hypothetical protein
VRKNSKGVYHGGRRHCVDLALAVYTGQVENHP